MPKIQSFWFGEDLPLYICLAAKSFVDHGHEYILYTYRDFEVPSGVVLRDAAEILPQSRVFFYGEQAGVGRGSVAVFSNLFRYHLLNQQGGWWVDADVICLSASVPPSEIFVGWEYEDMICNAILKLPAGHALARDLRDAAESADGAQGNQWGATGPSLLTRLIKEHGLLGIVHPQDFVYPVQSMDALHLLMPERREEVTERIGSKPFLHIWNEVQRRAVILPWVAPPQGSVLADLLTRHGFDLAAYPVYTPDQIVRLNDNYYAAATWSHAPAEKAELERLKARLTKVEAREREVANRNMLREP